MFIPDMSACVPVYVQPNFFLNSGDLFVEIFSRSVEIARLSVCRSEIMMGAFLFSPQRSHSSNASWRLLRRAVEVCVGLQPAALD